MRRRALDHMVERDRQTGGAIRPGDPLVYAADAEQLGETVREKWLQLEMDAETKAFVDNCEPNPFRDGMATMLRGFMSRTDANGLSGRGKMFVLSKAQLVQLLPMLKSVPPETTAAQPSASSASSEESADAAPSTWLPGFLSGGPPRKYANSASQLSLLDIGSGDGSITERYCDFFHKIVTTETSTVMAKRLRARGWECFQPPEESPPMGPFDVITCFNVLDRCDKPLTLLSDLRERLRPETGRLVLAIVLPWCPFVEDGTKQKQPSEILHGMRGAACRDKATFEKSLQAMVNNVICKAGFQVLAISRVPYISEGDQMKKYYVLEDSIIVCKRAAL